MGKPSTLTTSRAPTAQSSGSKAVLHELKDLVGWAGDDLCAERSQQLAEAALLTAGAGKAGPWLASGNLHFRKVTSVPGQRGSLCLHCVYTVWFMLTTSCPSGTLGFGGQAEGADMTCPQ